MTPRGTRHGKRRRVLIVLPTALLGLIGCTPPAPPAIHSTDLPTASQALQLLEGLPPHGDGYYIQPYPYQRAYFGQAWADTDANGRGTRDDVLAGQLTNVTYDSDHNVAAGTFTDPYTGLAVEYVRGREEVDPVVVDHVVSLWEAWATGAWAWTSGQRLEFANDPLNLVATTYAINELKGPLNPYRWHPIGAYEACEFALRVVAVKAKYRLEIHPNDREWLHNTLEGCLT